MNKHFARLRGYNFGPATSGATLKRRLSLAAVAVAAALPFGVALLDSPGAALAADIDEITRGREVYAGNCAACHGANLEGQPDWQRPGPIGRYPAPPHDASGHTWHHSDLVLAQIIYFGTAKLVGNGYESDMPGFGEVLSEEEILAVLEFIKSTWPEREAAFQREVSAAQ